MHAQLKAAQERLETATAQCLRSFEKLKSAQTNVCNSLRSHSSAKMAAVHDYDVPPPETPAEAASENGQGMRAEAAQEDAQEAVQEDYFDEDTQITLVVEELPEEKLTESKLLEKRQKSPKISGSSQLGLAAP